MRSASSSYRERISPPLSEHVCGIHFHRDALPWDSGTLGYSEECMNEIVSRIGDRLEAFYGVLGEGLCVGVPALVFDDSSPDLRPCPSIGRSYDRPGYGYGYVEQPHDGILHEQVDLTEDRTGFADGLHLLIGQGYWQRRRDCHA